MADLREILARVLRGGSVFMSTLQQEEERKRRREMEEKEFDLSRRRVDALEDQVAQRDREQRSDEIKEGAELARFMDPEVLRNLSGTRRTFGTTPTDVEGIDIAQVSRDRPQDVSRLKGLLPGLSARQLDNAGVELASRAEAESARAEGETQEKLDFAGKQAQVIAAGTAGFDTDELDEASDYFDRIRDLKIEGLEQGILKDKEAIANLRVSRQLTRKRLQELDEPTRQELIKSMSDRIDARAKVLMRGKEGLTWQEAYDAAVGQEIQAQADRPEVQGLAVYVGDLYASTFAGNDRGDEEEEKGLDPLLGAGPQFDFSNPLQGLR